GQVCMLEKRYAAAARFHRDAFASEPRHAEAVLGGVRYNATCCAALAGCGQGKDAASLDDKERARWRQQGLNWLRADLTWWTGMLDRGNAQSNTSIQQALQHWQSNTDLAGVRDRASLEKLPEAERQQWQKLWAEVAALLRRASPSR